MGGLPAASMGESWIRVKKFQFCRKISEKFRFFQAIIFTKNRFLGQISEKVRFLQVISQKISIFQGKFPKNIDFFRQFPKKSIFQANICYLPLFLYANYSISLQKSPLSNILPVHDKI